MKITLRSIAVLAMFFTPALAAHATPAFVQQNYATPQTPQSIVAVTYTKAQVASDTNVVVVGWNDTAANVVSIADSKGNNYALALPTYRGNGMSQAIYYAPSIAAAAVGTNTVTVTFDRPAVYADIRIAEYSGLNGPSMDGTSSGTGSARTASSGLIQTTANGDLLVGAGVTSYAFSAAGSGYTKRVITLPDTDILEDRISGSPGAYSATAIDNDLWVMQIAAFKVGSGAPDTTPPSVPANLHATGITNSSIALAWDPSTDNVGVAGYKLYRDGLQIATTTGASYTDSNLAASTTYRYAVAAFDTAGNVSAQSSILAATTLAPDTTPPSVPAGLASSDVTAVAATVSWSASSDDTGVAGYVVYRDGVPATTTTSTTFSDSGLTPGASYAYSVSAFDVAGNISAQSSPLSITTDTIPNAQAYPLRAAQGGRYLIDQKGTPVMVVGDAPQPLMGFLSESDADYYFANRQADGFNAGWVNLICDYYTGCNADGTTYNGIAPFTTPGDLSTPNPVYFAHADRVLEDAAAHGITLFLDPAETGGWLDTLRANGTAKAFAYGAYLGKRYKDFPNIVWMSGNDFQTWQDQNDDALAIAVAEGIESTDPNHLQTAELSYLVSNTLDDARWAPVATLNASYTYAPTYANILSAYNESTAPVYLVEANYEFEKDGPLVDGGATRNLRLQEWWTMTSGATGQLYGSGYTDSFKAGWQSNLDTPGVRELGLMKNFFSAIPWYTLVPDQSHAFLTAGYGTFQSSGLFAGNDYATAAIAPNGTLAVVYTPVTHTLTLNMGRFAGPVSAVWYDPTTGAYLSVAGSPFANSGSLQFTTPGVNGDGDADWALLLTATSTPDTTPPSVPANLHATGITNSSIALAWDPSTDNVGVAGYKLYRDGLQIATTTGASYTDSNLAASTTYAYSIAAFDFAGNASPASPELRVTTPGEPPITIGETSAFSDTDGGNGNVLLAQDVALPEAATIESLSFNVRTADGALRLGIYDATGPGGGPGVLKAWTDSFVPVLGWNTKNVTTPTVLPAGNYWLAYLPSSSNLAFPANFAIGTYEVAFLNYGPLPSTFPTVAGSGATHWSLYATLQP